MPPTAEQLARITLYSQWLCLDIDEYFSFAQSRVLYFMMHGLRCGNIAECLNISIKTVEYRVAPVEALPHWAKHNSVW